MQHSDPAIQFLLSSTDPSIRYFTLTDLGDASPRSRDVIAARKQIPNGERVQALFAGQDAKPRHPGRVFSTHPGGFGFHPYLKWIGSHWRLVSLVELGIPAASRDKRAHAAADQVLTWLTSDIHREQIKSINGRARRCASQEGNALAVCSRLGMTDDPRVQYLAQSLIAWQWQDGGWNCDVRPQVNHSSFYESLAPMWGLVEYHRATGDKKARAAAAHTAEFFLRHRLFRSETTGKIIDQNWLKLHYPLYWHYDILQALVILSRAGKIRDPRCSEALDILESKRRADGTWHAEAYYWKPNGASNVDVVDWGRRGPNEMITLNALRVLKAAGRV
ncbi:MAG: hypothetical protein HZB51_09205 [Chloroflexi bacterium]|nr:hypothetical protein [Chloroflexota bacterium]